MAQPSPTQTQPPKKKSNTTLIVVLIIVVVLVVIAVGGCVACRYCANKVVEEGVEQASGLEIGSNEDGVSVKSKDGDAEISTKTGEIPEGFPETLPTYGNADVESGSYYKSGGETIYSVVMSTEDDYYPVKEFFKSELQANWPPVSTNESSSNGRTGTTFTFNTENDPGSGFISVTEEEDKTTISYSITMKD
ncbi:hypothetical protein ACFL24_00565 [Patescibacteria group bacterium]